MPFVPESLQLTEAGPDTPYDWLLTGDLSWTGEFRGKVSRLRVPASPDEPFTTDLASVPRALTWLFPRYGTYTKAAVLHDYLCHHFGTESLDVYPARSEVADAAAGPVEPRTLELEDRSDADEIFRLVMHELGVPWARRWVMWSAVTWATLLTSLWTGRATKPALGWVGRFVLVAALVAFVILGCSGAWGSLIDHLPGPDWVQVATLTVIASTAFEATVLLAGSIAQGRWDRWLVSLAALGITAASLPLIIVGATIAILLVAYLLFEDVWSGFAATRAHVSRFLSTPPADERTPREARVAAVHAS